MTIGTEAAARAEPDGNTVLLVANAFVVNMAVKRGNFTLSNFEPVCNLASTPMPLVVQSSRALEDGAGAGRRRQGQSRQDYLCQRRARDLAACRDRGAAPRHQDRHQLRALWRQRPCRQRADGRSCAGGLGRLSDRGVAAQERHAARAGHHLAEARSPCCPACRSWKKPASPNTRPRFSTASWRRRRRRRRRSSSLSDMLLAAMNTPEMKTQVRPAGPVPGRHLRREVRRLPARHHRRLREDHHGRGHQAELTNCDFRQRNRSGATRHDGRCETLSRRLPLRPRALRSATTWRKSSTATARSASSAAHGGRSSRRRSSSSSRASDALTNTSSAKKKIHHLFCRTCGVGSFSRGLAPNGDETFAINVNCLDDVDVASSS